LRFEYTYKINGEDCSFKAPFEFTNLSLNPTWEAAEELERGNIHTIDLSFETDAFIFEGKGVTPVDAIIVEMFYQNGVIDLETPGSPDRTMTGYPE
jgi:hypothetical protein